MPAPDTVSSPSPQPRIRGPRKWLLRAVLAILAPIIFCGILEGVLRLAGYGHSPAFVLLDATAGVWRDNRTFSRQFAPPQLAPLGDFIAFPAVKAPGTQRIFIFGESAAIGIPDPNYSFPRALEVMLRGQYPGQKFEVINASITAVNSHVILPIARDCANHEPDLFIVYMGNNEVVGPFGPATVMRSFDPSLTAIRAGIAVRATRAGQLLERILRGDPRKSGPAEWIGLETFAAGALAESDPRRQQVAEHFRTNLGDIIAAGRSAGAGVIVCTVGVNLGDCPPFVSLHRAGIDRSAWEQATAAAVAAQQARQWEQAAAAFTEAARLDPDFAETHYRLALCLEARGEHAAALEHFSRARDLDAMRIRADSHENQIIRDVTTQTHDPRVVLADIEREIAAADPADHGITNGRLFWEHVHYRFEGNYLVARLLLPQVEAMLPANVRAGRSTDAVPTFEECRDALALTPVDLRRSAFAIAGMTARPPFTGQYDHIERQQRAEREGKVIVLDAKSRAQAVKTYERAIASWSGDWRLHDAYSTLLAETGDIKGALEQAAMELKLLPDDPRLGKLKASMLMLQGKCDEAIVLLKELVADKPGDVDLLKKLGDNYVLKHEVDAALDAYQRALAVRPHNPAVLVIVGAMMVEKNDLPAAADYFQKAIDIDDDAGGHFNLGLLLRNQGKTAAATEHVRKAVAEAPGDAHYRCILASLLDQQNRPDEALAELRTAVAADPKYYKGQLQLGELLVNVGKPQEGAACLKRAIATARANGQAPAPDTLVSVAMLLASHPQASVRDGPAALEYATEAVKATGGKSVDAVEALGVAYAEVGRYADAGKQFQTALNMAADVKLSQGRVQRLQAAVARVAESKPLHN